MFTANLFEQYAQEPAPRPRIVTGSYMADLDAAREATAELWRETYGVDLPESITYQDYILNSKESLAANKLLDTLFSAQLGEETVSQLPEWKLGFRRTGLRDSASRIRNKVYETYLEYNSLAPRMNIDEPLLSGYPLLNSGNRRNSPGAFSQHCVVTVFAMNALRLIQTDQSPGESFDSQYASWTIDTLASRGAVFDLPWLLGSLTTRDAQEQSGHAVGVVATVGADFGDIEDKVLKPLRSKKPELQFMLNAIIQSDSAQRANHAVNVVSTPEHGVTVLDPKYEGERLMSKKWFWERWLHTNLQTVITVARPK
jgi:hypothetical protein